MFFEFSVEFLWALQQCVHNVVVCLISELLYLFIYSMYINNLLFCLGGMDEPSLEII
jgi:hypothetical protein